ncbi:MAG TPA: beta-ketoacyl synthase N-terminal-like domain-containing protein [Tepidisphaeraceae bacterium]|nr:beta-ketoacyl synthase N-terminal-like domain-containing protein [Tepidisphaeraceae bacterium]
MAEAVYVLGAGRTDFKRNLSKEGKDIRDVIIEAGRGAIGSAGIDPADIQSGVVGNFAGGLFTRQLHLGAFLTDIDAKLRGIPTLHTEAACASGSVAVLTAAQQIMGGLHDVVLVVGAEQQKTMSPAEGSDVLGAAGDYRIERPKYGDFMFPKLFADIAQRYAKRYGLTERQLSSVAFKNYAHARLNPNAQMRDKSLRFEDACAESAGNTRIAPPLKLTDCSQISDGAAAVVLVSERFARKQRRNNLPKLLGYGHTTDHLSVDAKDIPEFPYARAAADRAYSMAGVGPRDLHGADVHDCFSISEIVAYEVLSFAERGQGPRLAESGATALPSVRAELGGSVSSMLLPVNPGGGLIGDGHPVGATGVRQVVEMYQQLTDSAGARQIEGARRYLTFNMGGTMTTSVAMIWGT